MGGEIFTLKGTGIGPRTAAFEKIGPDGKVSNELAGVQVFFDDIPAPLLYVQAQQINAVVPWEIVGLNTAVNNSIQVHVKYNGTSSNVSSIPISLAAPGIFLTDYSTGQAAVLNADGTPNSPSHPAKRGSVVAFFGTGGGNTNPAAVTGGFWPTSPLAYLMQPVTVQISGVDARDPLRRLRAGDGFRYLPDQCASARFLVWVGESNRGQDIDGMSSPQSSAYLTVE